MLLLEPIMVGTKELRNRVACNAHLAFPLAYHPEGDVADYLAYVRARAEGGVGLFTLQSLRVRPVGGPWAFPYEHLRDRLGQLAAAVHAEGGHVVVQLQQFGARQSGDATPDLDALWGMSPTTSPASGEGVHPMTEEEIGWLLDGYARTAELAVEAGVDGVELAGSHGYLLYQSESPRENRRTDAWGEPLALWRAVLGRVRAAMGPDAILGARVCSDDVFPDGVGRQRLGELAVELAGTGLVDYLNPTEGAHPSHYVRVVGTFRRPHGDFLAGVSAIRAAVAGAVPVLGAGRMVDVAEAEAALQAGHCDLVGMTRAHIADPDVVRKLARGQLHRIRPCVGANQGCIDRVNIGQPLTCFHNPDAGRERRVVLAAATARSVLVVGAGPAGLRAAVAAARRGHRVTLVDRSASVGGRLAAITDLTRAVELLGAVRSLVGELDALDVDLRLGTEVGEALVEELRPDAVILATGSLAPTPTFPTDGSIPLLTTAEACRRAIGLAGADVLVHDEIGNEEMDITWEQLAAAGARVRVVTPNPVVGAHLGHTHKDVVARLLGAGCAVEERTTLDFVESGSVVGTRQLSGERVQWRPAALVLASRGVPDSALLEVARRWTADVRVVGDAYAVRSAMHAFREGDDAGRAV